MADSVVSSNFTFACLISPARRWVFTLFNAHHKYSLTIELQLEPLSQSVLLDGLLHTSSLPLQERRGKHYTTHAGRLSPGSMAWARRKTVLLAATQGGEVATSGSRRINKCSASADIAKQADQITCYTETVNHPRTILSAPARAPLNNPAFSQSAALISEDLALTRPG